MICAAGSYDYGHAGCCGCECDLDLASEPPRLIIQRGNLETYFFYCPDCFAGLQAAGSEAWARAVPKALRKGALALPDPVRLAITTSLDLQAHGGDLVRAFEIGAVIPPVIFDAIVAGEAEAAIFPVFGWEE